MPPPKNRAMELKTTALVKGGNLKKYYHFLENLNISLALRFEGL